MQELSQEQLLELVKSLSTRLDAVESELAELKARSDSEISEDAACHQCRCVRVHGQQGQG